jgi:protein-tyrosine phosphatase
VSEWFKAYGYADVLDDLLVGAYPLDAADVGLLGRMGIRRVMNLAEDDEYEPEERLVVVEALAEEGIEEARVSFEDHAHLPAPQLESAVQQVVAWLADGERTYLHCRAGWQRSAAVAAGIVAILEEIEIGDALARVQMRKPSANPLPHQRAELFSWWQDRRSAAG